MTVSYLSNIDTALFCAEFYLENDQRRDFFWPKEEKRQMFSNALGTIRQKEFHHKSAK